MNSAFIKTLGALLSLAFFSVTATSQQTAPDLILLNGKIFTSAAHPYVQGLAVHGERIVATGDSAKINSRAGAQSSPSRIVVRKQEDLPQFTYPMTGTAQVLLTSDDATFNVLASQVKHDLDSVLQDYDIQDRGVLVNLLSDQVDLQMLFGDDAQALKTCEQMRALFDKPDMKATGMFNDLSFLRARIATGQSNGEAFQLEYEKDLRSLVESLPWEVVAERIRKRKARFEKLNTEYVKTQVENEIEPFVTKNHALDFPMATRLIFWRGILLTEVPQRQVVLDILSAYIKEHGASQTTVVPLEKPPVAPARPVTDEYFGMKIVDNYRYMENLDNPEVQSWMKGQVGYARSILDSLPGRENILARIKSLMSLQAAVFPDLHIVSGKYYLLRIPAGAQSAMLFVRNGLKGEEKLLIDPDKSSGSTGQHASISFYAPSPDNSYIVYGLSPGGSENAVLHIFDVSTGQDTGEMIDRARYASPHWRDSRSFYYTRLQEPVPNASPSATYEKSRVYLHTIGHDPKADPPIFGFGLNKDIQIQPNEISSIWTTPGFNYAVAVVRPGVDRRRRIYVAPLQNATDPNVEWRSIASNYEDGIVAWESGSAGDLPAYGNSLYLISRKHGPNGEIIMVDLSLAGDFRWQTVVPAGLPISALQTGRDGLYIRRMNGATETIETVTYGKAAPRPVTLPFLANVTSMVPDLQSGEAMLLVLPYSRPPLYLRLQGSISISDAELVPSDPPDKDREVEVREVMAKSWDETEIPLSIVYKKGLVLDGSHPALLIGYGAYGTSTVPIYNAMLRTAYEYGVVVAFAHVRGGGEYGESWHLAGYKLTKPNTWRDFIACAEYLIGNKYTQAGKLTGMGTSAGGILIGRAITERPDLFGAAIANVGVEDTLRLETTANGPGNTSEFGSIKTQEGFEDLYTMSSYAHVRDEVKYPAVLVTAGINDRRVDAWEPAKFAARLQAATASEKLVLFRVDYDAGHGSFGATADQLAALSADQLSFVLWQTGDPQFQSKQTNH
jgi:prolyl oligopeptidase